MKKIILRFMSLALTLVTVIGIGTAFPTSAAQNPTDLQNQINEYEAKSRELEKQIKALQAQKNDQAALKKAIEAKIANTQSQINLCNSEISKINNTIAANKAEIKKKNEEIEADKTAFKKRLRAIYMSNTNSNVQVLMGAESFSDYLALSQLTSAVSAHDKAMIEKIVAAIAVLNAKNAENEKLLEQQVSIKATIAAKQKELQAEQAEIQGIINSISANENSLDKQNDSIEATIKSMEATLRTIQNGSSSSKIVYDGGAFLWPVPGFYNISSPFGYRAFSGRNHNGIDVAQGGISGAPIVAIADGEVYQYSNSCSHNYGKANARNCCGNGYGNYVAIDHGGLNGKYYTAFYAHMSKVIVGGIGTKVKKGQVLGYVGSTGSSTGFHLHFGLTVNKSWVNPMNYYSRVK